MPSPPCTHIKTRILSLPFRYCKSNTYGSTETDGEILHHGRNRGSPLFVHPHKHYITSSSVNPVRLSRTERPTGFREEVH